MNFWWMGVYTIPEAMRFVPGMSVVESTSLSQSTGHGLNPQLFAAEYQPKTSLFSEAI